MNTKRELTNIIKASITLFVILICFACSNDDDSSSEPTTMQLLTADKWYMESSTLIIMTECRKQTWVQFLENEVLVGEGFYTDVNDNCISNPLATATWQLLGNSEFTITSNGETLLYTIISMSEDELTVSAELDGETQIYVYDKNPGNG
ncbi:MAG: hypothetical protein R2797_08605 [Gelidibacter sp.]